MSIKGKQSNSEPMAEHEAINAVITIAMEMRAEGLEFKMGNTEHGIVMVIPGWHFRDGRPQRLQPPVANGEIAVANDRGKSVANPEVETVANGRGKSGGNDGSE